MNATNPVKRVRAKLERVRRDLAEAREDRSGRLPPICTSVAEWAAGEPGTECQELFGPRPYTRHPPHTIAGRLPDAVTSRITGTLGGRYLVPIRNARLLGQCGIVILPDGRFTAESIYGQRSLKKQPEYRQPNHRPLVQKAGDYFSLLALWSVNGNYYHWTHDTLTRLFGVASYLPPETRYIVPANLNAFQRDSLDALGITEDRRVGFAGDEEWELETLHFAPPTSNSGSSRAEVLVWLRDALLEGYGITPASTSRRIYMTRRDADQRRILNEDVVEDCLLAYGFETCAAAELSHREQVALFAEAEVVIGPHGAGLVNTMYAPSGLKVVELVEKGMTSGTYIFWSLSDALRNDHWLVPTESVPRRQKQNDARVPVDHLVACLEQMQLATRPGGAC